MTGVLICLFVLLEVEQALWVKLVCRSHVFPIHWGLCHATGCVHYRHREWCDGSMPGCPEACTAPSHLKLPAMIQWDRRPQGIPGHRIATEGRLAFRGCGVWGSVPLEERMGSPTKRNLVFRLLIHVQFSLTTYFYVITDIWAITDRAHFENCYVNDSLWFDKSCRDTGSCVASMALLREDTAPETICLAGQTHLLHWILPCIVWGKGPSETTCCCCARHVMPSLLSALDWRYFTIHVELT